MREIKLITGFIALFGFATFSFAADGPLMNFPLNDLGDDKEILILEINLEPGQSSAPHRHNGHHFSET